WNALPNGWGGQPSIWGQTDETTQAKRTVAAIERVRAEWPWMGAMILENLQPVPPLGPQFGHVPLTKDPRWGFALVAHDGTPRPVYDAVKALITGLPVATPGVYPASTELATFVGYWELNPPGASAMTDGDAVSLPFEGAGVALTVARSPYLGYLYVTVDGQPANTLPRDPQGRAYAPLYGTLGEATTIPLATGLLQGRHTAVVTAAVGGGGWWLVDWRVARERDDAAYQGALVGMGTLALLCVAGVVLSVRRAYWGSLSRAVVAAHSRLSAGAQIAQMVIAAAVFRTSAWTAWYERAVAGFHRLGDTVAIIATLIAATTFYFSPWLPLTLVSGLALAALILLRLDLGLPLVVAAAPFYLYPRALFGKAFSMVEILTLLCALSWGVRQVASRKWQVASLQSLNSLDLAVLFFVLVAMGSFFVADYRHVALRELRVLILEPALFYLMLRTARLDRKAVWRVVDFFVLGAVIVALIGLVQYAFCDVELVRQTLGDVIRAEHDFRRLRSVYGSPNSVGLYLGRALPLLVAVALFGASRGRRIAYGLTAIPVGLAILLSFSKGALMLGVPLSMLALGVLAGGQWFWAALGTVIAAATAAIPLLRTPRFASLFDTQSGTLFFRLHLWRSSWAMFWEHPWLGVGPDNFLYHYRSRYILPAAWEEPHLSQAHNVLLDYGTRMGIAGLAAGVWLQVAFWRLALPLRRLTDRDHRGLALGLMASMVNFLAHGLVDASYFLIDLAFAFFLTLVVVQWLARSETDEF
ncbi:MAG: O-antigen ligase family protein, partial [Chloroflexi bacterium]|nr:O-antigen ligase family protein [Chloroflexota bacterium]